MRRYANRNHDFMGGSYPTENMIPAPRPDQLDPQNERLIQLSLEVGRLQGTLDLLSEDNGRLEDENKELRAEVRELREQNSNQRAELSSEKAAYSSGKRLVDEIETALKEKLERK